MGEEAFSKIDRYLMFYAQSTAGVHIRVGEQNVFLSQIKILIHYSIHIPPLRIEEIWRK